MTGTLTKVPCLLCRFSHRLIVGTPDSRRAQGSKVSQTQGAPPAHRVCRGEEAVEALPRVPQGMERQVSDAAAYGRNDLQRQEYRQVSLSAIPLHQSLIIHGSPLQGLHGSGCGWHLGAARKTYYEESAPAQLAVMFPTRREAGQGSRGSTMRKREPQTRAVCRFRKRYISPTAVMRLVTFFRIVTMATCMYCFTKAKKSMTD